jgi:hypothetical protein
VEVQEARPECQEVGDVAQMLCDDDASAGTEHAAQFGEERAAHLVGPELVRREQQDRRVDRSGRHRQAAKVGGLRRDVVAGKPSRACDRRRGHRDRIEDIEHAPARTAEQRPQRRRRFVQPRVDVDPRAGRKA